MWTLIIIVAVLSLLSGSGKKQKAATKQKAVKHPKNVITVQDRLNTAGLIQAQTDQLNGLYDVAMDFDRKSRLAQIRLDDAKKNADAIPSNQHASKAYKDYLNEIDKQKTAVYQYAYKAKKAYTDVEKMQIKVMDAKRKYAL